MKNIFNSLIISLLLTAGFCLETAAQSFDTGGIEVALNDYGRVRVYSPGGGDIQIDRSSLLVGVSSSAVFDYLEDAENVIPAETVDPSEIGDFQIRVTVDNTYSDLPPAVEVVINIYGWTDGAFAIAHMNITNNETDPINAVNGIEIIGELDGEYGFESVAYDNATEVVEVYKTTYVGYKFLSATLTSLKIIDWFDGYGNDADYYTWLTQNTIDPPYTSGVDGAVSILGQEPLTINSGESIDFYFGISIGANETMMLDNMALAELKYNDEILPVELTSFTANTVDQNVILKWETATEINNQGFEIQRKLNKNWSTIGFKEGAGTTTEKQTYSYTDITSEFSGETVYYRLKQIDFDGTVSYSDVVEVNVNPVKFSMQQNFPNPFNPSTNITFSIPKNEFVTLKIYNAIGQEVATLVNENLDAGKYSYNFNAENLTSGIYFYKISAGNYSDIKKMTLIK